MRSLLLATAASFGLATAAHAGALTVSAGIGALPSMGSYDVLTFDGPTPAGVSLTLSGDAAIVSGTVPLAHVAPEFSGGQGALNGAPDGADGTNYMSMGSGWATLKFAAKQTGLFWVQGSTDEPNLAVFSDGTLIGTVSGKDIASGPIVGDAVRSTYGVNVASSVPFDSVTFSSPGFVTSEIDTVAFASSAPASVPEPASLVLLCAGLLGFGAVRSRCGAR